MTEKPRRSARARKSVVRWQDENTNAAKPAAATEDGAEAVSEEELDEPSEADDDFAAKKKSAPPRGAKRNAPSRRAKSVPSDLGIADDNALFEAARSDSSLQLSVDDWVQSYLDAPEDKGQPMADLINFVFRCCGCNESVDKDEVLDLDAATDHLDTIQRSFQKAAQKDYPLTASKSKSLKRFRSSLAEFLSRLIQNTHTSEILYDEVFCETFQTWLAAATSSRLRSFRHTTTVIALDFTTALCKVAVEVAKEFNAASRSRDAEAKKSHADKKRLQVMDDNVHEAHQQKVKLEEYLKEMFDGVFVHRYRDAEPSIRCECVRSLGQWMQTHPEHYLDGDHLRYLGWNLTDVSKEARLEAVQALETLYAKPEQLGTLQHFTERFKGRLVEMACSEPDLTVRKAALACLAFVNTHGLLEEDQRADLAKLVFHVDVKIRQSVATFYVSLIQEAVDDQLAENAIADKQDHVSQQRLWLKCAAALLFKHATGLQEDSVDAEGPERASSFLPTGKRRTTPDSRIALAVDALWTEAETLQDWEGVIDYLLLDHSGGATEGGSAAKAAEQLEAGLRLDEAEETTLIEVAAAALARTKRELDRSKDDDDGQLTRSLMPLLPRLLDKYHAEPTRVLCVLQIATLMNMELYLDMRMLSNYENLWDQINKVVLHATDVAALSQAVQVTKHCLSFGAVRETNGFKRTDLINQVVSGIRIFVEGKDVATASFSFEEIEALTAWLARLSLLAMQFDVTACMEDNGGLRYTSMSTVVDAIAERGMIGSPEEEEMTIHALDALFCYLSWSLTALLSVEIPSEDDIAFRTDLRDSLLLRFQDLAVGTASSATEHCRRSAFAKVLQLHMLVTQIGTNPASTSDNDEQPLRAMRLECPDEVQYRCAGFIEAQIQQYAAETGANDLEEPEESETGSDDEHEADGDADRPSKSRKSDKAVSRATLLSPYEQLEAEYAFNAVISTFVKALALGVVQLRHSAHILAHIGRLGSLYNECAKYLVETVRDEGLYNGSVSLAVGVLQETFEKAIDLIGDGHANEIYLHNLIRTLTPCFLLRGQHANINKKLPDKDIAKLVARVIDDILGKYVSLGTSASSKKAQIQVLKTLKAFEKLIIMVEPPAALTIQKHLEQVIDVKGIRVGGTDKKWDAYRSFMKKLSAKIAKDPEIVRAAKRVRQSSPGSDEEHADLPQVKKATKAAPKRSAVKPPTRSQPRRSAIKVYAEAEEENADQDESPDDPLTRVSPRKRPRSPDALEEAAPSSDAAPASEPPIEDVGMSLNGQREEEDEVPTDVEAEMAAPTEHVRPPNSQASQASLSAFRRKRSRR